MYESCFGPEVVKEIRKEMKMAAAKCSSNGLSNSHQLNSPVANKNPITFVIQPHKPPQQAEGLYSPELLKSQTSSSSDFDKLQQFILAGFNKQNQVCTCICIFYVRIKLKKKKYFTPLICSCFCTTFSLKQYTVPTT